MKTLIDTLRLGNRGLIQEAALELDAVHRHRLMTRPYQVHFFRRVAHLEISVDPRDIHTGSVNQVILAERGGPRLLLAGHPGLREDRLRGLVRFHIIFGREGLDLSQFPFHLEGLRG